jgi:hypothetical protein
VLACTDGPTELTAPQQVVPSLSSTTAFDVSALGTKKEGISGSIAAVASLTPGRFFATPSGRCNFWDWPAVTQFSGDVSGSVTFVEQIHAPCSLTELVGSGPFSGEVTWNGRTGAISGQWTTNCNPDASQLVGLSCDGTMNARGSGGLEGVHFHFVWGPGWYPFPYVGTAFSD